MVSRKVSFDEAQRNLEKLLKELASSNGELLIERDDGAVFVVVPLRALDREQLAKERFAGALEEIRRKVNLDPEEADRIAEEMVRQVRANRAK